MRSLTLICVKVARPVGTGPPSAASLPSGVPITGAKARVWMSHRGGQWTEYYHSHEKHKLLGKKAWDPFPEVQVHSRTQTEGTHYAPWDLQICSKRELCLRESTNVSIESRFPCASKRSKMCMYLCVHTCRKIDRKRWMLSR